MQDSKNGSLQIVGNRFRKNPDQIIAPDKFPNDLSDLLKNNGVFFIVMLFLYTKLFCIVFLIRPFFNIGNVIGRISHSAQLRQIWRVPYDCSRENFLEQSAMHHISKRQSTN